MTYDNLYKYGILTGFRTLDPSNKLACSLPIHSLVSSAKSASCFPCAEQAPSRCPVVGIRAEPGPGPGPAPDYVPGPGRDP